MTAQLGSQSLKRLTVISVSWYVVFNPLPSVFAGHNDWIPMDRLWKDNDFCLAWTLFCSPSVSPSKSSHSGKNILPCCKPLCGEAHKARNWYLWPTASEDLRHAQPVYTWKYAWRCTTCVHFWDFPVRLNLKVDPFPLEPSIDYIALANTLIAACKTPWFKG